MDTHIEDLSDVGTAAMNAVNNIGTSFVKWIQTYLTWDNFFKLLGTLIILLAFWAIYRFVLRSVKRVPREKMPAHRAMLIQKLIRYAYYIVVVMFILGLFGIKFSAIWGAAGVAGVALAFAAQTSVSNIISGVFVISEKALKIGDLINVAGETGYVDTIGLLSVKIHTLDNQMIRIPNSTIINSTLRNTSYFPSRRLNVDVSVSYDTDMKLALDTLQRAPLHCPDVLEDPAPCAWFNGFDESGISLTLAVWFASANFLAAKNEAFIAVKKVFDEAGIEIPYNKLDVKIYEDTSTHIIEHKSSIEQKATVKTAGKATAKKAASNSKKKTERKTKK